MDHAGHNMAMATTLAVVLNTTVDPHAGMNHAVETTTMDHSGHGTMDMGSMDMGSMDMSSMNMAATVTTVLYQIMLGCASSVVVELIRFTEYILLYDLKTNSNGTLAAACIVMFFLSMMYEGLKFLREFLLRREVVRQNSLMYTPSISASSRNQMVVDTKHPNISMKMLSSSHVVQTILHMLQVFLSYCLMLVFMTYNVWLCLCIILGAGFGYFLFGWRRAMVVDINEHCH